MGKADRLFEIAQQPRVVRAFKSISAENARGWRNLLKKITLPK